MIDNQIENLQSLREYLQQESCQPQEDADRKNHSANSAAAL